MGFLPSNTFGFQMGRYVRAFSKDEGGFKEAKYLRSLHHSLPSQTNISTMKVKLTEYLKQTLQVLEDSHISVTTQSRETALRQNAIDGQETMISFANERLKRRRLLVDDELTSLEEVKRQFSKFQEEVTKIFEQMRASIIELKMIKPKYHQLQSDSKGRYMFVKGASVLNDKSTRAVQLLDVINNHAITLKEKYGFSGKEIENILRISYHKKTGSVVLPRSSQIGTSAENSLVFRQLQETIFQELQDLIEVKTLGVLNKITTIDPLADGVLKSAVNMILSQVEGSQSGESGIGLLYSLAKEAIVIPIDYGVSIVNVDNHQHLKQFINRRLTEAIKKKDFNATTTQEELFKHVKVGIASASAKFSKLVKASGNKPIPVPLSNMTIEGVILSSLITTYNMIINNANKSLELVMSDLRKKTVGTLSNTLGLTSENMITQGLQDTLGWAVEKLSVGEKGNDLTVKLVDRQGNVRKETFNIQLKTSRSGKVNSGKFLTSGSVYSQTGSSSNSTDFNTNYNKEKNDYLALEQNISALYQKMLNQSGRTNSAFVRAKNRLQTRQTRLSSTSFQKKVVTLAQNDKLAKALNTVAGSPPPKSPLGLFPLDYLPPMMGIGNADSYRFMNIPQMTSLYENYIFGQVIPTNLLDIHHQIQISLNSNNVLNVLSTLTPIYAFVKNSSQFFDPSSFNLQWFTNFYTISGNRETSIVIDRVIRQLQKIDVVALVLEWLSAEELKSLSGSGQREVIEKKNKPRELQSFLIEQIQRKIGAIYIERATKDAKLSEKQLKGVIKRHEAAVIQLCKGWCDMNSAAIIQATSILGVNNPQITSLKRQISFEQPNGLDFLKNIEIFYKNYGELF